MTQEQFQEIQDELKKWRDERHLTQESQREGLIGNLLEELTEYARAKDDLERIDALCDMVVFCLNAFKTDELRVFSYQKDTSSLLEELSKSVVSKTYNFNPRPTDILTNGVGLFLKRFIGVCINIIQGLGFNPYLCMKETIKEISSRTGEYDDKLKKFVKDTGFYNLQEAECFKEGLFKEKSVKEAEIKELDNSFEIKVVFDVGSGDNKIDNIIFAKWYKADYEACRN
ncbi:hypothetical protein CQA49_06735 [Helicobacter sp. MIT 00-7814]|uniref:hypothetical protein n=1 Tax=unclassified Helicobacter TaxID=2593540 RepID=UPI000E1F92A6|nr:MULTISPECIES: hypothetical protein [unclassified Helicobacter]RDU53339.1 hypothetical protein CQA49_06735 [Helicobacter sp. MIT 00-7814]RDU54160.1 hypothetical protein CQA37_05975 [Helicobacter sp. MIT 99-10781]